VKEHSAQLRRGEAEPSEAPNPLAPNYLLHDSLVGGGTESLKTDAQGKAHAQGLLMMKIDVPDEAYAGRRDG
jgi:hypothetical protein